MIRLQLLAVASRVPGVLLVNDALVGLDQPTPVSSEQIEMTGLQLPRVLGISVVPGAPRPLDEVRNEKLGALTPSDPDGSVPLPLPVPALPEEC